MPPKQRITRDMILDESFAMFKREGMEAVNARSIAKALNCSTQPIFSYFSGMDDLKKALDQRARESYRESIACSGEGKPSLVGVCSAYVRFAGEQPRLFAHLFMQSATAQQSAMLSEEMRAAITSQESERSGISGEQAKELYASLWAHAHGMAAARAVGLIQMSDERISERLGLQREGEVMRIKGCSFA